jgi:biopolymer transport protein ExbB
MRSACAALLLLVVVAPAARAAERGLARAEEPTVTLILDEESSLWQLYLKGGIVMHSILIASIVALAFSIERGVVLRQQVQVPGGLVEEAMGRLSKGGTGALVALVRSKKFALARLLDAALSKYSEGRRPMEEAASSASYEILHDLRRNVRPLGVIANVAPLLGLLGTVFGMIRAFDRVSAGGLGRGEQLAGGIAEALLTTGAGLLVAIPALLLYHFYRGRSEDLVRQAEAQTAAFIERALGSPQHKATANPAEPRA